MGKVSISCWNLLDRHYILQEDTHYGEKPENVKKMREFDRSGLGGGVRKINKMRNYFFWMRKNNGKVFRWRESKRFIDPSSPQRQLERCGGMGASRRLSSASS